MSDSEFIEHRPCPACGSSDALGVYTDGHGYCFACDTHFSESALQGAVDDAGDLLEERNRTSRKSRNNKGPQDRDDLQKFFGPLRVSAIPARSISEEACRHFGYSTARVVSPKSKHKGELVHVAPYHDPRSGEVVAYKCRTKAKEFFAVGDLKRGGLFGHAPSQGKGKRLVITEGEIDCLSVWQALGGRWPVVSLKNGADKETGQKVARELANSLDYLDGFEEIVLCFDQDKAGRVSADAAASILPPGKVSVVTLPGSYKDPNEMLLAGEHNALRQAVWGAKPWRPDGVVCLGDDAVIDEITKIPSIGVGYPWPFVTTQTLGFQPGQIHTIGAGSGTGKSVVCAEIALHWRQHGLKVGYLAFEEGFGLTGRRLIGIVLNKPVYLPGTKCEPEEMRRVAKELAGEDGCGFAFIDKFGSLDPDVLFTRMRYMWAALGIQAFIIDHLSILFSGSATTDERKLIDVLMTRLRMFTEETGTFAVVITHLARRKNDPFELGGKVTMSDARGSGAIEQLSDVFIGLERDQQAETQEERDTLGIRVVKVRLGGRTGVADTLRYIPETGRLKLIEDTWDENSEPAVHDQGGQLAIPEDF